MGSEGVGGWGVSDGVETAGCVREGGGGFSSRILLSGHFSGGGLFAFAFRGGPG